MTDRWTTADIARELGMTRATARQKVKRWKDKGLLTDVEIDLKTSERRYLPAQILAARATDRQGARTDLKNKEPES